MRTLLITTRKRGQKKLQQFIGRIFVEVEILPAQAKEHTSGIEYNLTNMKEGGLAI